MAKSAEAEFWSGVLGENVAHVYQGVPIIEVADLEDKMGIRDIRDAFNEVASPTATCVKALMEYERAGGTEWQVLIFSGNYADGTGFAIKSNRVRPSGDLLAASRETAATLLQQRAI